MHWELVEIWSTWAINHVDESQRRLLNEILAYGKTLCHNMLPQNGWNVVDISLGNRPRERNVNEIIGGKILRQNLLPQMVQQNPIQTPTKLT